MNYTENQEAYYLTKNSSYIPLIRNQLHQLSWSNIDLFLQCRRCFYNNVLLGIKRPGPDAESFKLSKTIEEQLKKELDVFRERKQHHPIMAAHMVDAIPFNHALLTMWRNSNYGRDGIRFYNSSLNLTLFGAIDDIWISPEGKLIIVEIKTTSTTPGEIIQDNPWYESFKRQISFYAFLFKMNGYPVHHIGYFIYCNGLKRESTPLPFDNRLEFEVTPSPCIIDHSWIEQTIKEAMDCLGQVKAPEATKNCNFCTFALKVSTPKTYPSAGLYPVPA